MAYSDQVILEALARLLALDGPDRVLTHDELAAASGASRVTVQRAVTRLRASGAVTTRRRSKGYQYRIHDEHTPAS